MRCYCWLESVNLTQISCIDCLQRSDAAVKAVLLPCMEALGVVRCNSNEREYFCKTRISEFGKESFRCFHVLTWTVRPSLTAVSLCTSATITNELLRAFCTTVPLFHGWILGHSEAREMYDFLLSGPVFNDSGPCVSVLCCSQTVFLTCFHRIGRMTERGWHEAKDSLTEDKVSVLTAVQLFIGEFIFTLSSLCPVLVHDVTSSWGDA